MKQPGDVIRVQFSTTNPVGATTAADSAPTAALWRNGQATAEVVTVTAPATALYLAEATIPAGWALGDDVALVAAAMVSGIATQGVVWAGTLDALVSAAKASADAAAKPGDVMVAGNCVPPPLPVDIAAVILADPSNLLATNPSGQVEASNAPSVLGLATQADVLAAQGAIVAAIPAAPDNAGIQSLNDKLPAELVSKLAFLDSPVGLALKAADYVAPDNAAIAAIDDAVAANLDAAVSTRATPAQAKAQADQALIDYGAAKTSTPMTLHADYDPAKSAASQTSVNELRTVADGVKTKTDQLTFTEAGRADATVPDPLGVGQITVPLVVKDQGNAPLPGVFVWAHDNIEGTGRPVAAGYTDGNGAVTFYLNAGSYYYWRSKVGYTFASPQTLVVTE
jgi:hypothetical protein